jgi:hypothetical protein
VPISGSNAKRVLFGALNLATGARLFQVRRYGRGADFRSFLSLLRGHWRGWHLAVLLDEDSCHTAGDSRLWADILMGDDYSSRPATIRSPSLTTADDD